MTSQSPENGLSPDNQHQECRHVIDHAEVFALGALDRAGSSRIEQHLIWCGSCRRAIADVRRVTDLLPFLSEPAAPSASVKAGLFDRIEREQAATPLPQTNPWLPSNDSSGTPTPPQGGPGRPASQQWQRWLPPALLAPLAIILLVTAAWANSLRNEINYLEAGGRDSQPTAASAFGTDSGGMQLYSLKPTCPTCNKASGRFGGDPNGSVGVVVAWNLDPSQQHQVWCVDEKGEKWMVSNLDVEPSGNVFQTVSFPQPLGGYQQIYVARHDGTANPDAELLVAMDEHLPEELPTTDPAVPTGT